VPPTTGPATALGIDPDAIHDEYDRAHFGELSDAELFDRAASAVSVPRRAAADSFVLHAPLELMARHLLLPLVPPRFRREARERMLRVAATYERAGEPVDPTRATAYDSVPEVQRALVAALRAGDLGLVDAAAGQLLRQGNLGEVMALAGPTYDMLAAAGHAPIAFSLVSRCAASNRSSLTLLRPVLRELARGPGLRVHWVDDPGESIGDGTSLVRALGRTPRLGVPGSDFVFPVVHQVDATGVARDVIGPTIPTDVPTAAAATLRVAAHSMIQDDPAYAPYGWTHCLTLPHAIFDIVRWLPDGPRAALVAATYVVGFRAALGGRIIDDDWRPAPSSGDLLDALEEGPTAASASWYAAPESVLARALPELIGQAACHADAHVVKYTWACLAAAARDGTQRPLYVAAAAALAAWWRQHPHTAFREDL
jgi:hypothetical protein